MSVYTVGAGGQTQLPRGMGERWAVGEFTPNIRIADLGDGVLVVPDGAEWPLVEAHFPESDLKAGAEELMRTYDARNKMTGHPHDLFGPYKVSRGSTFSLPSTARKRWGISGGGNIQAQDLNTGLLITSMNSDASPDGIVPVDMFEDGGWLYNKGAPMTAFLMRAFGNWANTIGDELADLARHGGTFEGIKPTQHTGTQLAVRLNEFVVQSALRAATDSSPEV